MLIIDGWDRTGIILLGSLIEVMIDLVTDGKLEYYGSTMLKFVGLQLINWIATGTLIASYQIKKRN